MLEELPTPTATTGTTTATTTMVSPILAPFPVRRPPYIANPYPGTGFVGRSHIIHSPNTRGGETVPRLLRSQRGSRKSCRPWTPHDLISQDPGQTCGDPYIQPREPISELRGESQWRTMRSKTSRTSRSPLHPREIDPPHGLDQGLHSQFQALRKPRRRTNVPWSASAARRRRGYRL
jgi:hypothetical protein